MAIHVQYAHRHFTRTLTGPRVFHCKWTFSCTRKNFVIS